MKKYKIQSEGAQKLIKTVGLESNEKLAAQQYFFGGESLGIPLLCAFIMDGEILGQAEQEGIIKCYDIKEGQTSIHIANDDVTNGAKLTLKSPLKPIKAIVEEKQSEVNSCDSLPDGCSIFKDRIPTNSTILLRRKNKPKKEQRFELFSKESLPPLEVKLNEKQKVISTGNVGYV